MRLRWLRTWWYSAITHRSINFGQFMSLIAEIILYRYFIFKLSYAITGPRLLQCLCSSGFKCFDMYCSLLFWQAIKRFVNPNFHYKANFLSPVNLTWQNFASLFRFNRCLFIKITCCFCRLPWNKWTTCSCWEKHNLNLNNLINKN